MVFCGSDISSVYRDICRRMISDGERVKVRSLETLELSNVQVQLYKPRQRFVNFKARAMSMKYFVGELCYFLEGRTDLSSIAHYSKFWEKVSDDGKTVNSAYGYRLFRAPYSLQHKMKQFQYALKCLEEDESSRKSVMTLYWASDGRESKDNPCTMFLQLLIRGGKLHLFVHMRSNDIWLGTPYDVAFFTIVQEVAWVMLRRAYPELQLGTYFHSVTSLHAYANDWPSIAAVAREGDHNSIIAPVITDVDVKGWFDDLLTYEKSTRDKVIYKGESKRTPFQDWCRAFLK